jgi:hypothetical protein
VAVDPIGSQVVAVVLGLCWRGHLLSPPSVDLPLVCRLTVLVRRGQHPYILQYPAAGHLSAAIMRASGRSLDWLGRSFQATGGTIRIELHDVIGNDEHVAALTTVRAERAGKLLKDITVQIFHLRDGQATEVWTHPADLYAADDFWS